MKTRILSIMPTKDLRGGGEKSFFEILKYTQSKGYENTVIVPRDVTRDLVIALEQNNIQYVIGQYNALGLHTDGSLSELIEIIDISKIIKSVNPDVFMTNLYVKASQLSSALNNVPHIYFDRGQLGLLDNAGQLSKEEPDFIRYANAVLCNSKNGQNILKNRYSADSVLVYSFVDKPVVRLKKYQKPRIIVPANFFQEKNHIDILKAVSKIISQKPNSSIEVVFIGARITSGNDEHYNNILNYIKSNDLDKNVKIIDHQKNPWDFFSTNDIYVNSGEGEAVGRSTSEAEMLGISALIADIPGHWEHKNIFGNKFTFKLHDIDDLVDKINYLMDTNNTQEIKNQNKQIQEKILKWMTPDNTMGEIINVIERVKQEENIAKDLVHDDLLKIATNCKSAFDLLNVRITQLEHVESRNEELGSEVYNLRYPGVKFATRKLLGSIKRKIVRVIKRID